MLLRWVSSRGSLVPLPRTERVKVPWTPLAVQTYTPLSSTLAPGIVSTPGGMGRGLMADENVGGYINNKSLLFINPRRACAARVTVVGSVCVCVCVCLLSHISPMERLFVLKTLSRTQRATKVKLFVGFSLKPLRCRDPALPPLCCRAYSRPFFLLKARMRILAPPSVFPAYNYISAATRLFAFATSCPAQRGKADVPVRFTC